MNVLSLFDGISCGQLALSKAGIKYDNYYSSEIDKSCIEVTKYNFPNTIQLGDVTTLKGSNLPKIDLLIGGSPCQGFSFSGKLLNFDDPRSKLFFEFVRLLDECNPKYFLLENVVMKKQHEDIITNTLKVNPVKINSALVSAQNRERLYWSNFVIEQPKDTNISLKDILDFDDGFINPSAIRGRKLNEFGVRDESNKDIPYVQYLEVKDKNKSNCLTTVDKDNVLSNLPVGRYIASDYKSSYRYYTLSEYCKLQTIPKTYFSFYKSETKAKKMIGNAWTVDVISHIFSKFES